MYEMNIYRDDIIIGHYRPVRYITKIIFKGGILQREEKIKYFWQESELFIKIVLDRITNVDDIFDKVAIVAKMVLEYFDSNYNSININILECIAIHVAVA